MAWTRRNIHSAGGGKQLWPRIKEPRAPVLEPLILIFFSAINLKNYEKTDGSGVLAWGLFCFLATPLLIASFGKFNFKQQLGV